MALANYNMELEYATNTLEFWLFDDANEPVDWIAPTTFNVQREDDETNDYSVTGTIEGNKVTFIVTPPQALQAPGDSLYDYDEDAREYHHIYSIRNSATVVLKGKLNLVEVA